MDKLVDKDIKHCLACQATGKTAAPPPIKSSKLPKTVRHTVNTDYLGPLPNGYYVFVIIDPRADPLIPFLIAVVYVSDNGPLFVPK